MPDPSRHLDGNAVAGLLQEVLVAEVTATERVCPSCGAREAGGAHLAFVGAGVVLRCPRCGDLAVRVAELPGCRVVEFRGTWILAVETPAPVP